MIITAPVTDYIPASVLTTHGDLVERGAANPERLAAAAAGLYLKAVGVGATPAYLPLSIGDTGVHIGYTDRDAGGDQVITGVGFTSTVMIFLAIDGVSGNKNRSWGFDNGTLHMCSIVYENAVNNSIRTTYSIYIHHDAGNNLYGVVSAIGGDGFTITWTLTGVKSANIVYLCFP